MTEHREVMYSDEYLEACRKAIYSEEYLDYLDFEGYEGYEDIVNITCTQIASGRFVVLYEPGRTYVPQPLSGAKLIPRCYGLLASEEVLESSGVAKVQRQPGLSLYGQGVLVGFVDTGECVIILSSKEDKFL